MSATSNLQERGLNATAAPAGPPLSPIASRRPSSFKLDVSSNSNQTAQPPTVQPIGHPNAAYGATHHSSTRPNSIPMPPPYDIAAGGVASPPLPKGIQMTPSSRHFPSSLSQLLLLFCPTFSLLESVLPHHHYLAVDATITLITPIRRGTTARSIRLGCLPCILQPQWPSGNEYIRL